MKKCKRCCEFLSYDKFHRNIKSKDGFKTICKECRKVDDVNYYLSVVKEFRNTDKKHLEYNRKYKENNEEFVSELKYKWSNSENGKKSRKLYYQKNSESIKSKSRNNRIENIELHRSRDKDRNRKDYMSKYIKKYRSDNPHIFAWRSLLLNTLKRLNTDKSSSTIEMLGYSSDDLKSHIEGLFVDGMSWDNYGDWHIDHKIPVSLFEKETDVSIVNALKNLQPLWAIDNLMKSNKIT